MLTNICLRTLTESIDWKGAQTDEVAGNPKDAQSGNRKRKGKGIAGVHPLISSYKRLPDGIPDLKRS